MRLIRQAIPVMTVMAGAIAAITLTAGVTASQATTHSAQTANPAKSTEPVRREGFRPNAASFISASTGFLVGGLNCTPNKRCPARLASTTDGGGHWRVTAIPGDSIAQAGQVLFASKRIGWVYGVDKLLATRDGGRHWHLREPGMEVQAMAVAGQTVYAYLAPAFGSKRPTGLYESPLSHSSWSPVEGLTGQFAALTTVGKTVWFAAIGPDGASSAVTWMRTGDSRWHRHAFTCPGRDYTLSSMAAASTSDITYLCTDTGDFGQTDEGMRVLVSINSGKTAHLVGHWTPIISGSGGVLAMAPGNTRVIMFATPPDAIGTFGRSVNDGHTWHLVDTQPADGTWNSLAFVSKSTGYIVAGVPGVGPAGGLLRTTDTGRTWHAVRLPVVLT